MATKAVTIKASEVLRIHPPVKDDVTKFYTVELVLLDHDALKTQQEAAKAAGKKNVEELPEKSITLTVNKVEAADIFSTCVFESTHKDIEHMCASGFEKKLERSVNNGAYRFVMDKATKVVKERLEKLHRGQLVKTEATIVKLKRRLDDTKAELKVEEETCKRLKEMLA